MTSEGYVIRTDKIKSSLDEIHTVNISCENGKYYIHNARNGKVSGAFKSLASAASNVKLGSEYVQRQNLKVEKKIVGQSKVISIIGVSKKQ